MDIDATRLTMNGRHLSGFNLEPSQDSFYNFYIERYEALLEEMVDLYRGGRYDRQPWRVAPAGRVQRLWREYMATGLVRDERGLERLVAMLYDNAVRLFINTVLSGHTELDPFYVLVDRLGFENEEDCNLFIDWAIDSDQGYWRITDYGFPHLATYACLMNEAARAESKLVYADMLLQVTHQRSDLAASFVEGGAATLFRLFHDRQASSPSG